MEKKDINFAFSRIPVAEQPEGTLVPVRLHLSGSTRNSSGLHGELLHPHHRRRLRQRLQVQVGACAATSLDKLLVATSVAWAFFGSRLSKVDVARQKVTVSRIRM